MMTFPRFPLHLCLLAPGLALGLAAPAWSDVPVVVTDIPAVGALAAQVMGDLGQPEVLLETGGDAHHYQLRPRQARLLQSAGLLVWTGPAMSPWLERASAGLGAASLPLLAAPGTHLRAYGGDENDHDHEEGGGEGGGEGAHDHTGSDPHAWLDPANGRLWLDIIAEALAERDPAHADTYRRNARAGITRIEALDARLTASLAPARGKHFAVFHDAYGYFTSHYGLEPAVAITLGDMSSPSAARLQDIRGRIAADNIACAFPETNHDPRLLQVAVEGTAVRLGGALDPEGAQLAPGPMLYDAILQGLADTLTSCLNED